MNILYLIDYSVSTTNPSKSLYDPSKDELLNSSRPEESGDINHDLILCYFDSGNKT